jgi:broad-specificity NMP kinase
MEQKLIFVSGSPCVGKTTVSDELFQSFNNSAYCDGDWMWCVNPFSLKDPRLRNGDKNVSFVLSNYLKAEFEYVFFSSVILTNKNIRENIIRNIDSMNYKIIGFSLMCSEQTLYERHRKRGDNNEVSYYWLRLGPYPGDYIINTDNKNVKEIVNEIKSIIIEKNNNKNK